MAATPAPGGPIQALADRLDRLEGAVSALLSEVRATGAEARALTAEVRAERATLDAYRAEVVAWREETTRRFDAIDRELGALAVRFFEHRHDDEGRAISSAPDPVGAADIAFRLGVMPGTVRQWLARYSSFPAPRWHVNGQATWDWPDVEAWAAARKVAAK